MRRDLVNVNETRMARRFRLASEAAVSTSHVAGGNEFKIANASDGNPGATWVGEGHPFPWQPINRTQ